MRSKIPVHVAIIPDGNRRWAESRGLAKIKGHEKVSSKDNLIPLFEESRRLGVKYLSIWGFSTENWNRSEAEKKFLFDLIEKTVKNLFDYATENEVRFRHIGRKDRLPKNLLIALEELEKETSDFGSMNIQLFLDYGGRDEIVSAANIIMEKGEKVDEKSFSDYLYTKEVPDVELIIRTGGEKRLSGFMLYQSAYAELYFTDIYFPDFGAEDLREAIEWFGSVQRRFGGD